MNKEEIQGAMIRDYEKGKALRRGDEFAAIVSNPDPEKWDADHMTNWSKRRAAELCSAGFGYQPDRSGR